MSRDFVAELLAAAGPDGAVARSLEAVLRRWGGQRVYVPTGPLRRRQTPAEEASELARAGVGTLAIQDSLVRHHGISTRHARRLARRAVDIRGQGMSASGLTLTGMMSSPDRTA